MPSNEPLVAVRAMHSTPMIPVIDIFAGPGGLGEGFSALRDPHDNRIFDVVLSIEKDQYPYKTLLLRSFFRQFSASEVPDDYYSLLRGSITIEDLFARHPYEASEASKKAWNAELGDNIHFPPEEVDRRISMALSGNRHWVLIGGPPCQAYSVIGRSRMKGSDPHKYEKDPRHFMYREYLRILEKHKPTVFVMENVKGMLSSRIGGKLIIDLIWNDLRCLKYRIYSFVSRPETDLWGSGKFDPSSLVVCSEKYGIPQKRHRVILLGIRDDFDVSPSVLQASSHRIPIWKVICDLPPIRSVLSRQPDSGPSWVKAIQALEKNEQIAIEMESKLANRIKMTLRLLNESLVSGGEFIPCDVRPEYEPSWFHDSRLGGVCNHSSRSHIVPDLHRYLFASCFAMEFGRSPLLIDFPISLLPQHSNIREGVLGNMFNDRFRVQLRDQPANTITSHMAKDGHYFIHPDPLQCRSLTVREAARIQTFPDNYFFFGPRTSQYQQVGNAVPPLLARQLASIIAELFDRSRLHRKGSDGSGFTSRYCAG